MPDEIKPLAIPLLMSEHEGFKKLEYSIHKIASEVQSIDRGATAKEIRHLEESIDVLHGKLTIIDWDISIWAKKNYDKIIIDSVNLTPEDAAHELVANEGCYEWILDAINITREFEPRFNDADISTLRDARRDLGADIVYLNSSLPQIAEFPDLRAILQIHQDLSKKKRV